MAQLFVDVIIKNTNGTGKSDRFWDSGEMNLLKALVLYVDLTYPPEQRNIGEVYNLITQCSESQLDSLFDVLPLTHPAKAPYSLYQRASDSVRSGVISGLGSRLQVFQSELIKKITAYDEISLELPGQQPLRLLSSHQRSRQHLLTFLHRCSCPLPSSNSSDMPMPTAPAGGFPVPVHVLGEELTACGTISELSGASASSAPATSLCPAYSRILPVCKTAIRRTSGRRFWATAMCSFFSAARIS